MNIPNGATFHDDGTVGIFITREFAEAIEDDSHLPYLRLNDPVQRFLADYGLLFWCCALPVHGFGGILV